MSELNASILSYPHRGHWGDNTYRGNCSGHVIKDLLDTYHPDNFIEVFLEVVPEKMLRQSTGIKIVFTLILIMDGMH